MTKPLLGTTPTSLIDRLHRLRVIPLARRGTCRQDGIDLGELFRGQSYFERAEVFVQVLEALRAGDGDYVLALGQHPRESELTRRAALRRRELADLFREVEVLLEVLPLKARVGATDVIGREVVKRLKLPGQEPAAERL